MLREAARLDQDVTRGHLVRVHERQGHTVIVDRLDERGDVTYNVDFRSIYAAVLDQWLKCDSRKIFGRPFKAAAVLGTGVRA